MLQLNLINVNFNYFIHKFTKILNIAFEKLLINNKFSHILLTVGIFYAYCFGPYLDYIAFQAVCLILPVIFIVTFCFMPETPQFYIMQGKRQKAYRALKFLRSNTNISNEYHEIEEFVEKSMKHKPKYFDIFKDEGNKKGDNLIFFLKTFDFINFYFI